jgi:hypothetical protein
LEAAAAEIQLVLAFLVVLAAVVVTHRVLGALEHLGKVLLEELQTALYLRMQEVVVVVLQLLVEAQLLLGLLGGLAVLVLFHQLVVQVLLMAAAVVEQV